jgi:hypothetical protein
MLGAAHPPSRHLAISLAIAAAQSGRRVYYGTLADLITSLEEAQAAGRLQARLKVLTHPVLLVVDEIGYLPITRFDQRALAERLVTDFASHTNGLDELPSSRVQVAVRSPHNLPAPGRDRCYVGMSRGRLAPFYACVAERLHHAA